MKLGFCGLGLMGSAMVRRLLAAGHTVQVWNRTPAKALALQSLGARVCATPAEAASGVDGVLLCLMDAASVEAVAFGPEGLHAARGLPWVADHSSIAAVATRQLARRLHAECGADWLDAPVSGGVRGVETGTLAVMVGGEARALPSLRAAIAAYAANVTHTGPSGSGQVAKLCNQIIVSTTVAAIAEAVGFAERQGLDPRLLVQAFAGGWADSRPLQVFVPRMAEVQPDSIGALSTMLKDVDTVLEGARACDAPLPLTASVQQLLRAACALGLGDAELSSVCSLFDERKRKAFLQTLR